MKAVVVGDIELSGKKYDICANKHGRWSITNEEGSALGTGDTLDIATNNARATLTKRKVKVEVPFVNGRGERSVATGFHARTGDLLTRQAGESPSINGMRSVLSASIPDEELARLRELRGEIRERENEAREIERAYPMNLKVAVEQAIREKVEEGSVNG